MRHKLRTGLALAALSIMAFFLTKVFPADQYFITHVFTDRQFPARHRHRLFPTKAVLQTRDLTRQALFLVANSRTRMSPAIQRFRADVPAGPAYVFVLAHLLETRLSAKAFLRRGHGGACGTGPWVALLRTQMRTIVASVPAAHLPTRMRGVHWMRSRFFYLATEAGVDGLCGVFEVAGRAVPVQA